MLVTVVQSLGNVDYDRALRDWILAAWLLQSHLRGFSLRTATVFTLKAFIAHTLVISITVSC